MTNKCTSVVGHFDGYGSAPGQYRWHRPMRHVQGYLRSHWMPPLGDYLLCIALTATRATGKQTTINKYTYFAGRFDSHGNPPVRNRVHCPMKEVQGFTRSHWAPPSGEYYVQQHKRDMATPVFFDVLHCQNHGKRSRVNAKAPVFNMDMRHQAKEKGLTKGWGGGVKLAE